MVVATPPPARTARKATGKTMELGRMRSTTSPARMRWVRRREETRRRRSAREREAAVAASRRHGRAKGITEVGERSCDRKKTKGTDEKKMVYLTYEKRPPVF
jgi:hypothetical protein